MEPTIALPVLIGLIAIALAFDFINGLHDAANSIATIVSTRVLSPQLAVAWAAFFNFVAFAFVGLHVAETIGKGIIDPAIIDPAVVFGALAGAILWNILTWLFGLPSSSSHALVGGLVGAGTAKAGFGAIVSAGVIKTSIFIFAAPLIGMVMAIVMVVVSSWLFRQNHQADAAPRLLRRNRGSADAVRRNGLRNSSLDHPYHHRRDHGGRCGPTRFGGALGSGGEYRHRLGPYNPGGRGDRRARLRACGDVSGCLVVTARWKEA